MTERTPLWDEAEFERNRRAVLAATSDSPDIDRLADEIIRRLPYPGAIPARDALAKLVARAHDRDQLADALERIAWQAEHSVDPDNHIAASWVAARARAALSAADREAGTIQPTWKSLTREQTGDEDA